MWNKRRTVSAARIAAPSRFTDFSVYAGKRIAVRIAMGEMVRVLKGVATFDLDESLGNVLRIQLDDPQETGNAELIISETEWNGRIVPDFHDGCDFCFAISEFV